MFKTFFILLTILFSMEFAFAKFVLDVGIIHKKGGEKGTPLVSELHSSEQIYDEPIVIKTKDGLELKVLASFTPEKELYGPSEKIIIKGSLLNLVINENKEIFLTVSLGEEIKETFEFTNKRIVEVVFFPHI